MTIAGDLLLNTSTLRRYRQPVAQAIAKANRLSKKHGMPYFVVFEDGRYEVASDYDLDTWYLGIRENDIVYSTE